MKDLLLKHNIQWDGPPIETGIQRDILIRIQGFIEVRHIIAISGARRSGKSYIFRQLMNGLMKGGVRADNIMQVNFEDPYFINRRENPGALEECFHEYLNMKNPGGKIYLFLDEIQNITGWQFWVRDVYDRMENVKIFITGSNSELLSNELATHLTGRVIAFENFPYSYSELMKGLKVNIQIPDLTSIGTEDHYRKYFNNRSGLIHHIERSFTRGLFPETSFMEDTERTDFLLRQYFQNVLFSDIIPRFSVRNTRVIEQLAYFCSRNITSSFSYHKLAEAVGSNENTVREYMSYFEKAYLFFEVSYFEYSLKKQFRRNRKVYIIDCGLRHASSNSFTGDTGKYAGNAVYITLRRNHKEVYYWQEERTSKEVDFVVKGQERIYAVNVNYTDEIHDREIESLLAFSKIARADRYIIVSRDTYEKRDIGNISIEIIPFWLFVLTGLADKDRKE